MNKTWLKRLGAASGVLYVVLAIAASYGKPVGKPLTFPLNYQAEHIGELRLAPRSPNEAFTPADLHWS